MTVVTGGAVAVTNVRLISPPGAVDDTVSTSQSFTLEGAFSFIGSVNPVGRTARLVLPVGGGYSISGSDVVTLGGGVADTASWLVTAPNSVTTPSAVFSVQLSAQESPSGNPLADTLDHTVYLVNRSALALSGRVLEPLGARDLTVSTDQSFVLSYGIDNTGIAGTTGSSLVRVVLPAGFSFDPFPTLRLIDTLSVITGDSSSITVYTGLAAYPVPRNISGTIISAALDENSNQASAVECQVYRHRSGL